MIPIEDLEKSVQADDKESLLRVLVKPGAGKDAILDVFEDRLRVSLKERAREGKANQALVNFLAKRLGVSKSSVTLLKGARSRQKLLRLTLSKEKVLELLKAD